MTKPTTPTQLSDLYRRDLKLFYKLNLAGNSRTLEVSDRPVLKNKGVSPMNLEKLKREYFDNIVITDALGKLYDVQRVLHLVRRLGNEKTRILFNYQSYFWQPILDLAEFLGLKAKSTRANWLNEDDILNLVDLEDLEIIKKEKRYLLPVDVTGLTMLINKYLARLPVINDLCLTNMVVAKMKAPGKKEELAISIVIPARNEKGNIEKAVQEIGPQLKKGDELIFVEGHSHDGTWEEIIRIKERYPKIKIRLFKQKGKGKADAVRLGFAKASGDWLLIWDADLTVSPEDLGKFTEAIRNGKGEFISGCRLVYPMEKQAMQFLNVIGNRFFSLAFSWLLGQRIKDTLCGSKAISRENYQKLARNRKYFGDFDPFGDFDLIFGAAKLNLKFLEIPIRYRARTYGTTNISRFTHGWLLLKMLFFALGKLKFV